jgi:acetolactate synthase small subunit
MVEREEQTEAMLRIAVQRRPGVLARIAALFDRRGIEMWRLGVCPGAEDRAEIRVHTRAAPGDLERLRRAIANLVDVVDAEVHGGAIESDFQFQ